MSRYIDADKLVELLRDECAEVDDGNRDIDESTCLMTFRAMHEFIDMIPTADVRDDVRSKWRVYEGEITCMHCGYPVDEITRFCPNCGARMENE